ncbi:hypothetical protein PAXRUDRAFT_154509 [Paxillus rubicundulus Ve08.2h10]|uniref:Uncharacterized protein n=1 Tax=Paxillus rubicundulus Ve08.2h10 TaxID=930991 RepID=A0A0D0DK98_9AGAM|nr:hypothetical protein PAXRUDRAFT_154509 [Paxillus rubicundulus Ve08.2h10]
MCLQCNYIQNHSPTKALTRIMPNETFHSRKPNVATLRIFGSQCHVRVPPDLQRKLDAY